MSFSSDIKQELNKTNNLSNKEIVKYELMGYLISGNVDVIKSNIKFSTESDYNINRFSKLLSNLDINHDIDVSRKKFCYKSKSERFEFYCKYTREKNITLYRNF